MIHSSLELSRLTGVALGRVNLELTHNDRCLMWDHHNVAADHAAAFNGFHIVGLLMRVVDHESTAKLALWQSFRRVGHRADRAAGDSAGDAGERRGRRHRRGRVRGQREGGLAPPPAETSTTYQANGMVLLGEAAKMIPVSAMRIVSLKAQKGTVAIELKLAGRAFRCSTSEKRRGGEQQGLRDRRRRHLHAHPQVILTRTASHNTQPTAEVY